MDGLEIFYVYIYQHHRIEYSMVEYLCLLSTAFKELSLLVDNIEYNFFTEFKCKGFDIFLQPKQRLEETAAENSRLEHEMMMLRQKIQMTMARNSQRESGSTAETRHIESEMVRVQTLLEDLQRRRIELSHQVCISL